MKEKTKLTKLERRIILLEGIFVIGVFVYMFFSTAPSQVYPIHGMTISEADFNIEIQNGEQVLISTTEDFANPIVLGEGAEITLEPGTYCWKVRSKFRESEVKNFTIEGIVGLDILERPENYELQNSGNVNLDVTKEKGGITSSITLDRGASKEVPKDDASYEGEQK